MRNEQKAVIRKAAKKVEAIKQEIDQIVAELDEYIYENQEKLDGTERGEKLDNELEAVYALIGEFDMLQEAILDTV